MPNPLPAFLDAACVPLDRAHVSGTLDEAGALLAAHPELASASIHAAAVLGEDAAVRDFLARDRSLATAPGGPRGWDPLTHLCFSRYLRLDPARSDGFLRAAEALLDAGADPDTGWWEEAHEPEPAWEPALYGAAGIAHHPELTRLLLERGAEPDVDEVVYHTPESYDNRALALLLETGRLSDESLSLILIRKHDWHDLDGARLVLEHGADPGRPRFRGWRPLHHAIRRGNRLAMIELLLDHGADPTAAEHGRSALALAAREGRGDLLELFGGRGFTVDLEGQDRLLAACARGEGEEAWRLAARDPALVQALRREAGALLQAFAGTDNAAGLRILLDLGVDVNAPCPGDGYWGLAAGGTALHAAAWRAAHRAVAALVERGARVDAVDASGQTPLALAVRACVDSYWTDRRAPDSVRTLLEAGAATGEVSYPAGYDEVDALLRQHGAGS